jgi:5,10-methylenetetrahydromethanopterin reductase
MSSPTSGVVLQGVDAPAAFLDLVDRIDGAGYDHLWLTDSSLHARNPFVYLSLAAQRSARLTLGTAVTNPVTRHPAIVAAAFATVDEIADRRAILGIGAGDRPLVALGERPAPLAVLRDAIAVIRRLLAGEHVTYEGETFRLVDAHLRFPGRADAPVYISASGPKTLDLAGEVADGVILLCGLAAEGVRYALEHIDKGAARAGRPRPHVALFAYGAIDEDEDRALDAARSIAAWFPQTVPVYCELAGLDPAIAEQVRTSYAGGEFQEAGTAAALLPSSFVRRMALAGGRRRTVDQLGGLRELGVDSVNVFPLGGDRVATVAAFAECWAEASG